MPFNFVISNESFVICAMFVLFGVAFFGLRVIIDVIARKRIQERWLLAVLLFGAIGFVLGSFGFAPIIFGIMSLTKHFFGLALSFF